MSNKIELDKSNNSGNILAGDNNIQNIYINERDKSLDNKNPNLVPCKICNHLISKAAEKCPECNHDYAKEAKEKGVAILAYFFFAVIIIVAVVLKMREWLGF